MTDFQILPLSPKYSNTSLPTKAGNRQNSNTKTDTPKPNPRSMKTTKIIRTSAKISVSLAVAALMTSAASAATIIYQDTFTRTGDLHASQLGVASGFTGTGTLGGSTTAAWKANDGQGYNSPNGITLNGTVASRVANDHAFLPFTPQSGLVYTYSLDIDMASSGQWGAFGFSKNNNVNTTPTNPNTGPADLGNSIVGWMLMRADDVNFNTKDQLFPGANYGGGFNIDRGTTGWNTLSLVLDTTAAQWTVQFYRGSTATGSPMNVASDAIDYIFIGALQTNSEFDNLSLTAIPEPAAALLGGLGMLTLLRRRRNA